MSRERSRTWNYHIVLPAKETARLRAFISEERFYFNTLVSGFSGPIRTMPDVLKSMTGRWESLFIEAAERRVDVRDFRRGSVPDAFSKYEDLLFVDGRSTLSACHSLLFEVAGTSAAVHPVVRRQMAAEILLRAREQSAALQNMMTTGVQAYKHAVQGLAPHDERSKRHFQLPRSCMNVLVENGQMTLKLPYLTTPITVAAPPIGWSMFVMRDEGEGRWTIELRQESSYIAGLSDPTRRRRK